MRVCGMILVALSGVLTGSTATAQVDRWTAPLEAHESVVDLGVLNDGSVVAVIESSSSERGSSQIWRYPRGEAPAMELAVLPDVRLNSIQVLEDDRVRLLVGGAIGETLVYRLLRLEDGTTEMIWDLEDVDLPLDREQAAVVVGHDGAHWAAFWIVGADEALHVAVGEVPDGKPMMTVDLQLTIDDEIKPAAPALDSYLESPAELPVLGVLGSVEGKPTIAAQWKGSTQIIRSSDRAALSLLRPSLHGGTRLHWSPVAQRLWVGGFHAWSAFDVTDPTLFGSEVVVAPELEIPYDGLESCDASVVRDRTDGTILVVDSQGRRAVLLRPEGSGELKVADSYDLGLDVIRARVSQSGRFVAGRGRRGPDGHDPKTIVRAHIPLLDE